MGDDGEIADVSEVCHARGYDLVLGFGQGGLMSSGNRTFEEIIEASANDSQPPDHALELFRQTLRAIFLLRHDLPEARTFDRLMRAILTMGCCIHFPRDLRLVRKLRVSELQIDAHDLTIEDPATGEFGMIIGEDNQTKLQHSIVHWLVHFEGKANDHNQVALEKYLDTLQHTSPNGILNIALNDLFAAAENLDRERVLNSPDIDVLSTELFDETLFPDQHTFPEQVKLVLECSAIGFWREWYQGFLDGKPLDWDLQRRVALIGDAIWEAGPEAVAAEIERIRSLFELEQEIANLKEQLTAVQNTPAAALIGDNGGPPLEDAPARAFQTDLALIWKQIEELEEEIAKPSPSPSLLKKIAKTLWEISLRMAAYCGSVADGMIREGTKELAKAGAKWTARATAVTVTAQTEGVQSVVKAIGAFVKTLQ
ncbi:MULTISPECIES: hypothetical protein [unclassified Phaeobacter]